MAAHGGVAAPVEVRAAAKRALAVRAHVADDGARDVAERLPALGLESEERLPPYAAASRSMRKTHCTGAGGGTRR